MYVLAIFCQTEDGIRDGTVTGVQTCALPISSGRDTKPRTPGSARESTRWMWSSVVKSTVSRSEERRVGKECGSRWLPERSKRKVDQELGSPQGWAERMSVHHGGRPVL